MECQYNSVALIDADGSSLVSIADAHPDDHFIRRSFYFTPATRDFACLRRVMATLAAASAGISVSEARARWHAGRDIFLYRPRSVPTNLTTDSRRMAQIEAMGMRRQHSARRCGKPLGKESVEPSLENGGQMSALCFTALPFSRTSRVRSLQERIARVNAY
jgi:N-carbamoylputrescine amidase